MPEMHEDLLQKKKKKKKKEYKHSKKKRTWYMSIRMNQIMPIFKACFKKLLTYFLFNNIW